MFDTALALHAARKESHWFIFPQLRDLGRSPTARFFGISSLEEARAYLAHEVLGCCDAPKRCWPAMPARFMRFSVTLFAVAAQVVDRWCDGDVAPA